MAARQRGQQKNKAMDRRLSRGMEQWAKELVVFDGDQVRRLTEREVRIVAGIQPNAARRRRAGGKGSTKDNS